jgi:hypothetical protein
VGRRRARGASPRVDRRDTPPIGARFPDRRDILASNHGGAA